MKPQRFRGTALPGFTVTELLVTIAVVLLLASLLLPALSTAKERTRRTSCAGNVRQFILAAHMYSHDNNDFLPRPDAFCTAMISKKTLTNFMRYSGMVPVLDCPNLHERFLKGTSVWPTGWREQGLTVAIGYHYLGGQSSTPWFGDERTGIDTKAWTSPQKFSESPDSVLIADLNTSYDSMTVVPHARGGAVVLDDTYFRTHLMGGSLVYPAQAGATGGNVGALDGSAAWRGIKTMSQRAAGREWNGQPYGWW